MESFVGIMEDPPGSNLTPIGEEYGWNGVAWCAQTVSVACNRLGFPLHEAAVIRIEQHAKAGDWGMTWTATPTRGAAVCFDWEGRGQWDDMHVGIVTEVLDGGKFRTIEGNFADGVFRVLRDMRFVRGFATFPFSDSDVPGGPTPQPNPPAQGRPVLRQGSKGGDVSYLQTVIYEHAGGNIAIDGDFGPQTDSRVRDVQTAYQIAVDGIVGPETWGVIERLAAGEPFPGGAPPQPAPLPPRAFGDWPYVEKEMIARGSKGEVVAYLQKVIYLKAGGNIAVDGDFGPQTEGRVRTVQMNAGITQDGIVGPQTWGVIDGLATS